MSSSWSDWLTLKQQVIDFACLTNFVALRGGALKREQMLSGAMADIFSNLYLAISVKYAHEHDKISPVLTNYVVQRLMNENAAKMNEVIDNLTFEKYVLQHMKRKIPSISYETERKVFDEVMKNRNILVSIRKNIYVDGVLKDMETALTLDKNSEEYKALLDKVINVGETRM